MPLPQVTIAQARRIALAAQGLAAPRPDRAVGMRDVQRIIDRLGQFQIDSINVVARAHQLPLFSRLGPYDITLLERAAHGNPHRLFEYWGHAASLIDVNLQPALRWRMADTREEPSDGMIKFCDEHPGLVERVLAEITERGPISARQIEHDEVRSREHWGWNWSAVKTACEWLMSAGQITSARRNSQFERLYAAPDRVLPAPVVNAPTPTRADAMLELVRRAARALGVASELCLRDYFRISSDDAQVAIDTLVASGELIEVSVPGWPRAWLWHQARRPRSIKARALLSPFDSMVFERSRLQKLFGVDYRIEIYVPEAKRRFGYYVYLFLLDEEFVARVDLKADRAADSLVVKAAWREPASDPADHPDDVVAAQLAEELLIMANWLGLTHVRCGSRGDLSEALEQHLDHASP